MRYCGTCGAPVAAHTYEAIDRALAGAILANAPHPAIGRSRMRAAIRVCPLVKVREGVYRAEWAQAAAPIEERKAA